MLGPEAGNDAAFAGAIFATVVLAVYGASGGFGASNVSTAQQAFIAASAAASIAATTAAYTGNNDWAEYLGYVALAVSVVGPGVYSYFTEGNQADWYFPEGESQQFGDYDTIGVGGIHDTPERAQNMANQIGGPVLLNPSQGTVPDVMQSLIQKFSLGAGDSLARRFADGVGQLRPGPITAYGHSQGSIVVLNAGNYVTYPPGSTFNLTAPAISRLHTSIFGAATGGRVLYRQNYFDMAAFYSPSFNPLRFLSGIPGFALTRWTHNWRNAYGP
jgi:hypothetical protein